MYIFLSIKFVNVADDATLTVEKLFFHIIDYNSSPMLFYLDLIMGQVTQPEGSLEK